MLQAIALMVSHWNQRVSAAPSSVLSMFYVATLVGALLRLQSDVAGNSGAAGAMHHTFAASILALLMLEQVPRAHFVYSPLGQVRTHAFGSFALLGASPLSEERDHGAQRRLCLKADLWMAHSALGAREPTRAADVGRVVQIGQSSVLSATSLDSAHLQGTEHGYPGQIPCLEVPGGVAEGGQEGEVTCAQLTLLFSGFLLLLRR